MEERTRLRMHVERDVPEERTGILEAGLVAHLGFEVEGQPFVIPMLYHFEPASEGEGSEAGRLYLHGSTKSRTMQHLAGGAPVCVTVTLLDQLVASKTALNHSANYRSAVCFGNGRLIEDEDEKNDILERMVSRYFEGRTVGEDYSRATSQHLKGTALVHVEIEAASGKARWGPPTGPGDDDPKVPGTADLVDPE